MNYWKGALGKKGRAGTQVFAGNGWGIVCTRSYIIIS